ncbi:hypothetical protein EST38_g7555 [Candolleomyces aberdarensis]|uniref:Uncharacterized protein n=1 Tax=Candolleomyces aberdarensis TaxID=2316362 RepID=A0A4Q2DI66_9AGAR|nr:hypothetical protein EST38_g7555 [Candolleomyces aberdarensis]
MQYQYPEQAHYGAGAKEQVQFQEDLPPSYQKEQDFVNHPTVQSPVPPPDAAHTTSQPADDRFVGGFRPQ